MDPVRLALDVGPLHGHRTGVGVAVAATAEALAARDDVVLVPYVPAELYARIRALEWRRSEFSTEERLKVGSLIVDRAAREVSAGGKLVNLTAKEFALLRYFMSHPGEVLSQEHLLEHVWDYHFDPQTNVIDVHISRLRSKLGDTPREPTLIRTVRGEGYLFDLSVT